MDGIGGGDRNGTNPDSLLQPEGSEYDLGDLLLTLLVMVVLALVMAYVMYG